jgi:hypothetical protein
MLTQSPRPTQLLCDTAERGFGKRERHKPESEGASQRTHLTLAVLKKALATP